MHSIFISDLHLSPDRARINEIFFRFLSGPAARAEALYILGDLFEYWAGDDDDDPFNCTVLTGLRGLADGGVALYLMHGNRDFLLGNKAAAACRAALLPDPTLIELYGTPTLLMHGDTLCTDDLRYLEFRTQVRNPAWQQQFLAQQLAARKELIAGVRSKSNEEKKLKADAIMDATEAGVAAALREHGYPRLIHGHTHRPALHHPLIDGRRCERWVLSDWYESGSYLRCDSQGCQSIALDR